MARDDYEVLLYKLLKYLFTCLKKDKEPQISEIAPRAKMFPISKRYLDLLIRSAYKEGLIENIIITELDGDIDIAPEYLYESAKAIENVSIAEK